MQITITITPMILSLVDQLALLSGFLQILGYVLYIRKQLAGEADPNPATWLMFSYGTIVLTGLEMAAGASWQLLMLPISCAILGCVVASVCWKRGRMKWPEPLADKFAFMTDLALTAAYAVSWILHQHGSIGDETKQLLLAIFLICSNASTFTSFAPLLRQAYLEPHKERSRSWFVWTAAYVVLGLTTLVSTTDSHRQMAEDLARALSGGTWAFLLTSPWTLFYYPITNMFLHGIVAVLVRPARRRRHIAHHKNLAR